MSIIHNGLSGVLAAQTALNTTSQNIANVMTPGYTRQGTMLASVHPLQRGVQGAGSGVTVPSLMRFSDGYKSVQMWLAASELGRHEAVRNYLTQLEQVMGDDLSNLNSGLDAFFGALNAASVEPASIPLRQQVITAADALAQRFNSLAQVLTNQRLAISQQREATVAQISALSGEIAKLNKEIAAANASGVNTSGLVDARDGKIDALASLVGVRVVDQADGTRSVSLLTGQPLVVGALAATLRVEGNVDGSQTLELTFAKETFTLPTNGIAGQPDVLGGQLGGLGSFEGRLGAAGELGEGVLLPLIQSLRDMAQGLAEKVNTQLGAGFSLDGNPGIDLFNFDSASASSMLSINSSILARDLAFSSDATLPGDSTNLLALIEIKSQAISVKSLGSVVLGDAATQLIGKLGMDSQQNQSALKTAETVRNQAEESWKSTSGVNQDEEAMNLIQYQQMYQANMKVIAIANELFDSTLAMMA